MHTYFILWVIILLCVVTQIIPALLTGSSCRWWLCLCDISLLCDFCLFVLSTSYFLAQRDASGSSYIFTAPILDSVLPPKNPGPFDGRNVLETKMRVLASVTF